MNYNFKCDILHYYLYEDDNSFYDIIEITNYLSISFFGTVVNVFYRKK